MTKAPERIWLTGFVKDEYGAKLGRGTISDLDHGANPDYPEYTRSDIVDALLKAEKEKTLREAAAIAPKAVQNYGMMKPGKPDQYASREAQIVAKGFARLIEEDILALVSKDKTDG